MCFPRFQERELGRRAGWDKEDGRTRFVHTHPCAKNAQGWGTHLWEFMGEPYAQSVGTDIPTVESCQ